MQYSKCSTVIAYENALGPYWLSIPPPRYLPPGYLLSWIPTPSQIPIPRIPMRQIPTPPPPGYLLTWDTYKCLWKHYLHATTVAGGRNSLVSLWVFMECSKSNWPVSDQYRCLACKNKMYDSIDLFVNLTFCADSLLGYDIILLVWHYEE